ncbi:diguanylate cyclase [Acidovorax sp.]|uniref:diguanylate cyclase n=1 Tax=Acidovorax sp. TaxID=1872122 RepID=UPI00342621F2
MAVGLCLLALHMLPMGAQAQSQEPGRLLVLEPGMQALDAWQAITLLPDASHQLGALEVLGRLREFQEPNRRGGSLGVRKEAVWLHIPMATAARAETEWIVNLGYSALQEVDMYLASNGELLQQASLGYLRPPSETSLSSRTPSMELKLRAGQRYDLLIRVRTLGPLILPLSVSEVPHHLRLALREQLLQGFLTGLAFCLLAYSLAQWASHRERLFAYYALVVLGSAGFSLHFFGIGAQFLWPGNVWMEGHAAVIAGFIALAGSFLFLSHVLAAGARHSRYVRVMKAGAVVSIALCLAHMVNLIGPRGATVFMSLLGPLPSLFSIPAAIRRVRQKDPIGATLLIAWTVYALAAVAMAGLVQGWLPANFWTLHAFQFGATLDMLLFLRVLGLRAQAAKAQAQETLRERDLMHSLAHSDPLTGLSNRRGLQHALHAALLKCTPQHMVAVYLMDLDGFKPINDSYGHDVGDHLLVAVGQRLQASVRHQTDLVARLGGDEFIVIACELASTEQAEDLGRSLIKAFEHSFALDQHTVTVGLTIGYALAPLDGSDAQALLRQADAAMYAGKQSGKQSIRRNQGELALSS